MNRVEISSLLDAYRAAVFLKDANAFMQLYDSNVRVFDTWGVWAYDGAQAWRSMVEEWFSSLGTERVAVGFDDVVVKESEGFAVVSAIVTYTGLSAENVELRAMQNRLTWVFGPEGSTWKVIHEHTSVPVDFNHATAILRRERAT